MSIARRSASILGLLILFTLVSCDDDNCPVCPTVKQEQEQLDTHWDDLEGGVHIIFPTFDSTQDAAQVFAVERAGVLSRVQILLTQKSGEGNFRLELRRCDNSGIPLEDDNDILMYVSFDSANLPQGPATSETVWLSVDLTSFAIAVQNGEPMAIVLRSSGPTITWWAGDMDPYKAGAGWRRYVSGGDWQTLSPLVDFMFRVYLENSSS